ncbi:MAG TPA: DNA-binding response regulator [Lachnoclostridium sp.]|jgi:two-component system response regulator YesN|uniref:response regulator transcription factor n=1 Tax=Lacrimispora sp. TaxID=2719234 RepID=UPI000EC03292|nr:helix-turn-helix domain-containing protein [Lacrimispora sp.]HCD43298.1 DNA-binding response regulator [Lachnoclostridium sp.]
MAQPSFRLLLADDEENILKGMENYIRKNTRCFDKIHCAVNGEEALDIIYKYHPDVMLVDVQMPIKSGLDVMKEALAAGVCPKTVILSGYDTFSYAQQALRLGAVDYLLKPCRSTEILQKLESIAAPWLGEREEGPGPEGNIFVKAAMEYMMDHMSEDVNLGMVAEKVGVSTAYLSTLFTQKLGCGFIDYLNRLRIECAREYMHDGRLKVYEIAYKVGYHDEKYFSKVFKKVTGQSPSVYRRNIGIGE